MQPYQNRMNVFVQPRAGGEIVRVTSETERDVAGYFWKGSDRIVYRKDFKGDENYHLVAVDADGANLVDLTPFEKVRAKIIDDRYDHDDEMIIGMNKRNPEIFDVYRVDLNTQAAHARRGKPRQRDRLGHRSRRTHPRSPSPPTA